MSISKTKQQLEYSRSVEIYRPVLNLEKVQERRDSRKIENCSRCSRGKVKLSGKLDYHNYHALASLVGQIEVDNTGCKLDIKSFKISLIQLI